jgi:hypothetical protein
LPGVLNKERNYRMRFSRTIVGIGLGLALVCTSCKSNAHEADNEVAEGHSDEVKMKIDEVPAAVRDGLARESGGAAIATVDKEAKNGQTIYEADAMINGANWELKVDENGKLISKKLDNEAEEHKGGEKEKDKD